MRLKPNDRFKGGKALWDVQTLCLHTWIHWGSSLNFPGSVWDLAQVLFCLCVDTITPLGATYGNHRCKCDSALTVRRNKPEFPFYMFVSSSWVRFVLLPHQHVPPIFCRSELYDGCCKPSLPWIKTSALMRPFSSCCSRTHWSVGNDLFLHLYEMFSCRSGVLLGSINTWSF